LLIAAISKSIQHYTFNYTYFTALHLPVMQTALNEVDKNEQTADVFWLAGV